ncbi:MAG: FGGY-family carbohydrate kinase [Thermoguttaceae bacterium]
MKRGSLLAVDVGTTGVNAMIFDAQGNSHATAYREYRSIFPSEHQVEQDAEEILAATLDTIAETITKGGGKPSEIAAIGVTSQRATFGLLNRDGELINNRLIVWQDNRAAVVIDEMASMIDAAALYKISGMPLTPTYTLEKLVWFKKFAPSIWSQVHRVVFPGDYILHRLGAELHTEVTSACCSGMIDIHRLDWSDQILQTFGLDSSLFAPLVKPGSVVGTISKSAAQATGLLAGTPLVCTTGDQQCAAIGAGVIRAGDASLTLGTAGLLVVATDRIDLEKSPGLMVPSSGKIGLFELEGIQLGAASCYRWARDVLAVPEKMTSAQTGEDTYALMERLLADSEPGARGVAFLPFLSGAGYPLWNPHLQGMFAGLRFSHSRSDMLRAVIEGVTLESYDMYREMQRAGVTIRSLTMTGGATASPIWRQTVANIFNIPVQTLEVPNATLLAAALFAAIGAKMISNVDQGVAQMVRFAESVNPVPEQVEIFRKTSEHYCELYTSQLQSTNQEKVDPTC